MATLLAEVRSSALAGHRLSLLPVIAGERLNCAIALLEAAILSRRARWRSEANGWIS